MTITATSIADSTKKASVVLSLVPLIVSVVVSPSAYAIDAGGTQQLSATVVGASSAVNWSIQPAIGSVSPSGLFTAPDTVAVNTDVIVTATSAVDPTKHGQSKITVLPSVSTVMGAKGLTSLKFRGQELLYIPKGSPGLFNVTMIDSAGNRTMVSTTPSSVTANTANQTVTCVYPWGVVTTTYKAVGNKLQIVAKVQNNSAQTIERLVMYPMQMQFPSIPTSPNNNPIMDFNVDSPSSVLLNYGTGTVDLVNDDVVMPLATGFGPTQNPAGQLYAVTLQIDPNRVANRSWPPVTRPIGPQASDTFTVSLRFGNTAATELMLAGDIFDTYSRAFPQQRLAAPPNKSIAALIISAKHRPYFPTNPRGWFNDPNVDVTTSTGIASFQAKLLKWADNAIIEMQRVGAQGGVLWDIEGQQFDTAYIGDPSQAEAIAPELVGVLDAFVGKFTAAGLRIGFTLRPPVFNQQTGFLSVSGTSVTWNGGTQFSPAWITRPGFNSAITINGMNYQIADVPSPTSLTLLTSAPAATAVPFIYNEMVDNANPAAVLKAKMQYAINRWGASIFYFDSNSTTDGSLITAAAFQDMLTSFPGTILIPEHANTRHYAYTFPYLDYNAITVGPAPDILSVYPGAAAVVKVDEGMASKYPQQLLNVVNQGSILMFDGWYRHPANDFIIQTYAQAH